MSVSWSISQLLEIWISLIVHIEVVLWLIFCKWRKDNHGFKVLSLFFFTIITVPIIGMGYMSYIDNAEKGFNDFAKTMWLITPIIGVSTLLWFCRALFKRVSLFLVKVF